MGERIEEVMIINSSGNVFADIGLENADELLAKSQLVIAIGRVIKSRGLTQAKVADLIGLDQPQVSRLLQGRFSGYSTDRLLRILNDLGQDVKITVGPTQTAELQSGSISVELLSPNIRTNKSASSPNQVAEPKSTYGKKKP